MRWRFLCAADLCPIEEGQEGIVTVAGVSLYVHDDGECRKTARTYPADIDRYKRRFDAQGNRVTE